jgi:hypothetical protein
MKCNKGLESIAEGQEKSYPKGTTKEQWDRYFEDMAKHKSFLDDYKFFLDRICRYLEFVNPGKSWTPREIIQACEAEIARAQSMDAPNQPGYYRANND